MPMQTILIIGLGNPGPKYARTRHNAGFMFADFFWKVFRDEFSFPNWEHRKKLHVDISAGKSGGKKIILAKPQTFMNLSGEAIAAAVKYFKVKLSDLIIIHDEIDLPLGKYKFSTNASSAGHKGVQNIIDMLGTKNFIRLRIGVDNRKIKKISTEKYVLGKFRNVELQNIKNVFVESSNELLKLLL